MGTAGHIPAWKNFPGCPGPLLAQPILQGGHSWASYPPEWAWGVSWGRGRGWGEWVEGGRQKQEFVFTRFAEVRFFAVEPASSFLTNLHNKRGPF